jgi:hypothetical protein
MLFKFLACVLCCKAIFEIPGLCTIKNVVDQAHQLAVKVKGKVIQVTKNHAMEESGGKASHILNFSLDEGRWSASCSGHFDHEK